MLNHGTNEYYASIYQRPEAIGLDVLYEKKTGFINTFEYDRRKRSSDKGEPKPSSVVHNDNNTTNLDELKTIKMQTPLFTIDLPKALEFIQNHQLTLQERDIFLDEFAY